MFPGKFGIMQGRLSPPINNLIQHYPSDCWEEEFSLCKHFGFQCIEWIFEYQNFTENALFNDQGIEKIKYLSDLNNVKINSVVADYFMINKFFNENERQIEENINVFKTLIIQCHKANIPIIEVPFVDSSSIKTEEHKTQIRKNLGPLVGYANDFGIKISLETDLDIKSFLNFIDSFGKYEVFINYDMGNSASLGYDASKEIIAFNDKIINVHIKDRVLNGSTVPLGTGSTDFKSAFNALRVINYKNDFIFQAARQDINVTKPINLMETIEEYLKFIKQYIS